MEGEMQCVRCPNQTKSDFHPLCESCYEFVIERKKKRDKLPSIEQLARDIYNSDDSGGTSWDYVIIFVKERYMKMAESLLKRYDLRVKGV
jgi:hypothetical protein